MAFLDSFLHTAFTILYYHTDLKAGSQDADCVELSSADLGHHRTLGGVVHSEHGPVTLTSAFVTNFFFLLLQESAATLCGT